MNQVKLILIAPMLFSVFILFAQNQKSNYHIVNKFSLEGDGGWDLLIEDETTGHLFVSHNTIVQVLDVKTGKEIGRISGLKGVHGIALAREFNKGYISCGRDTSVTIFNLKTFETLQSLKVTGQNPDAILYDPFTKRIFVFNARSSNATVIDASNDKIAGTIALDGKPELAVSNEKGKIYVNIEDKSMIKEIDPSSMKVLNSWPIAPGEEPTGLAIDIINQRLFTVCDNKLMVILDAGSGKVITSLPIGERVDGAAFDPIKKRAYSSNGDGTITVIQEQDSNSFKVLENIVTQKGARTIAIDVNSHHMYLPTAEYGPIPDPTAENKNPRPTIKPGSFMILDVEPVH